MTSTAESTLRREVSPLELFSDLVFVLAAAQLTHHLVGHQTWQGALETAIGLVAVCGVWGFTTFEVTLLDIDRRATQAIVVVVMGLGLFMNAGIAHAFADGPWLFVVPMVLALVGPSGYAALRAPHPALRRHFRQVLVWFTVSVPLWVAGAAVDHDSRLWLWSMAAAIDLVGSWSAHPLPGSAPTTTLAFDAEHMVERMRLFLIILLGETVLTLGRVISEHHADATTLLLAAAGFVALVCLWALYFARAEEVVVQHTAATGHRIRTVHVGLNVIYGVMAGLVVLAAGIESLVVHAHDNQAGVAGILLLAGPATYLLAQAVYFTTASREEWQPRAIGGGILVIGAAGAYWVPSPAAFGLLLVIVLPLTILLTRSRA